MRRLVAGEVRSKSGRFDPWWEQSARSTLVQVYLWEKDVESAWQEGDGHPLDRTVALELAAAREKTHPADVIPIYLQEAESLIAHKSKGTYEEAIRRLKQVKALHLRLHLIDAWKAHLEKFRTRHKAKRNFIALAAKL